MAGEGWAGMLTGLGGTVLQGFQEQKQKQLKDEEAQLGMHLHMFEQMYQDPDKYSRAHLESTLAVLDKNPALKKILGMAPSEAAKPLLDERDKQLEGMRKTIATTSLANNPPSGNMIANIVNGDPTQKAVDQFDAIAAGGSMLDARSFYASLLGEQRKTAAEATQYAQQRQLAQDTNKWREESELRVQNARANAEFEADRLKNEYMYGKDQTRWPEEVRKNFVGIKDNYSTGRYWAGDVKRPGRQYFYNRDGSPVLDQDGIQASRDLIVPGSITPTVVKRSEEEKASDRAKRAVVIANELDEINRVPGEEQTIPGYGKQKKVASQMMTTQEYANLQHLLPYDPKRYGRWFTEKTWGEMSEVNRRKASRLVDELNEK